MYNAQTAVLPATTLNGSLHKYEQTQPSPTKKKSLDDTVLVTHTPDEETPDGRIRNKEAVRKIRDAWIYKQVKLRQKEFTNYGTVRRVFACRFYTIH